MTNTNERMSDVMRTVRFAPYRKGMGPTFTLRLNEYQEERAKELEA